jgi:CheY-like chemotaxis protein
MQVHKIAIVDDEQQARESLAEMLQLVGFETFIVEASFNEVDGLVRHIQENAQAVICDHRLSDRGLAPFTGSELMPPLYKSQFPSLLITQYTETDVNVSIRKYREVIPVVLERDDLVNLFDISVIADKIKKGFETCSQEFQGIMSSARRPHRTLIHIMDITTDSGEEVAEVFVPSWNRHRAVRFPVSQIPDNLLSKVKLQLKQNEDSWLIARVNTEAEKSDDLYFAAFEPAPELDDNDGLA